MKRVSVVVVAVVLGVGLWSGPAWGESAGVGSSGHVGRIQTNPVRGAFAEARTVLTQLDVPSPLRSLLGAIGDELATLEAQLADLYDDLFVDTCPPCESG